MTKPSYEQVIVSVQYTVEWLISSVTPYSRIRQLILTYFCFLRNNSNNFSKLVFDHRCWGFTEYGKNQVCSSFQMTHQPKHIAGVVDFALLEFTSYLYLLISLYIGMCNVFYIAINWRRLRLEGIRGPLSMHICLSVTPLFFIGESQVAAINITLSNYEHLFICRCTTNAFFTTSAPSNFLTDL